MTARWVVDEVAPHRDLNLIWQPISLLFKNDPPEGTPYYDGTMRGHKALRIMEAIRAEHGGDHSPHVHDWHDLLTYPLSQYFFDCCHHYLIHLASFEEL